MNVSEEDIYYFAMIKGYIVPSLVIHRIDPSGQKENEMLFYSFKETVEILRMLSSKNQCSFEEIVDECVSYFSKPKILTESFVNCFKADGNEEKSVEKETKVVLKAKISNDVLAYIKDLILLINKKVDERVKNDCNN